MYETPQLGLAQVQAALAAMIVEGDKEPGFPLAIAVVDDHGSLVAYVRMDGCPMLPRTAAVKKAYTASGFGVDSGAFAEMLKGNGISVADLGDPNMNATPGGVAIRRPSDGVIMGAIGVSGLPTGAADEAVARIGLNALGL
jgi:uncharacterized protein GlcG (DUF336 family)